MKKAFQGKCIRLRARTLPLQPQPTRKSRPSVTTSFLDRYYHAARQTRHQTHHAAFANFRPGEFDDVSCLLFSGATDTHFNTTLWPCSAATESGWVLAPQRMRGARVHSMDPRRKPRDARPRSRPLVCSSGASPQMYMNINLNTVVTLLSNLYSHSLTRSFTHGPIPSLN